MTNFVPGRLGHHFFLALCSCNRTAWIAIPVGVGSPSAILWMRADSQGQQLDVPRPSTPTRLSRNLLSAALRLIDLLSPVLASSLERISIRSLPIVEANCSSASSARSGSAAMRATTTGSRSRRACAAKSRALAPRKCSYKAAEPERWSSVKAIARSSASLCAADLVVLVYSESPSTGNTTSSNERRWPNKARVTFSISGVERPGGKARPSNKVTTVCCSAITPARLEDTGASVEHRSSARMMSIDVGHRLFLHPRVAGAASCPTYSANSAAQIDGEGVHP